MFTKTFTALLALTASALAYTTPTTFNATSNPIYTPTLKELVPVGKPYKITWGPTESGKVSIILLRGPSSNVVPLYAIADSIANSGSFTWTPKTNLEPDDDQYGLQLIIEGSGQYQYSVQFGISNPDYVASSSTTSAAATSTSAATSAEETTTSVETVYHTTKSQVTSVVYVTTSSAAQTTLATSSYVAPVYTSSSANNYTATYAPTASTSSPATPSQTGAASSLKVASSLLLGVAGVAAMLL